MTSSTAGSVRQRLSWVAVPWPVFLIAGLMFVGLMAVAGAYGFHGDEMYFVVTGQHPAFGYVDQPPLTPLLSALEMTLVVVLIALIVRDLGGTRRAQILAATTAALSGYLGAGHLPHALSGTPRLPPRSFRGERA